MRGMAPRAATSILHWHGLSPERPAAARPQVALDDHLPFPLPHIRQVDVLKQT